MNYNQFKGYGFSMADLLKEKVKELEKQNRLLIENIVDTVFRLNAENLTYEYITPSIYKVSGYTSNELLNTSIIDRLAPDSIQKATKLLEEAKKDYERGILGPRTIELELMNKQGGTYWLEIRAKLMKEEGSHLKIVGVTREITDKIIAERQMEKQNRKLIEALEEKEKLINEIKVLRGLLPICSSCKRIRGDDGKWWPLDLFIQEHTESDLSHTICYDCKAVIYPELKREAQT